jgi:hypothetical protein
MMEAVPRWRRALLAGGLAAMALLLLLLGTAHHATRVAGDLPLPLPWRPAGGSGAAGATPLQRLRDVPTARRLLAGAAGAAPPPMPAAPCGYFVGYAEDEEEWEAAHGSEGGGVDYDDEGSRQQQRRRLLGRRRYTAVRGSASARARGGVGAGGFGVGAGRVPRRNTVRGAAADKQAKKMALVQAATLSKASELAIKQFGSLGARVRHRADDLQQRRRRAAA